MLGNIKRGEYMCEPASFVLTKDNIFWSKFTDSHEDIICEFKLHADGSKGPNILRVEIVPDDKNYLLPLNKWKLKIDQDITPGWFDLKETEKKVREKLPEWFESKIILPKTKIEKIIDRNIIFCYGEIGELRENSQVGVLWGNSQVGTLWGNSQVGTLRENSKVGVLRENSKVGVLRENSKVGELWENSKVGELWGNSVARIFSENSKVDKINGDFAVVLNYTGKMLKVIKSKKGKGNK
jgi:hypothetical protein